MRDNLWTINETAGSGYMPVEESDNLARQTKIIAVSSGKGGVGKTCLSLNLAISLTRFGHKVMVVDGDMGLANVDLMLGLTPRYNLSHVFARKKTFNEIVITGPAGVKLVPCSSGGKWADTFSSEKRREIVAEIKRNPDLADTVFVDTGGGITDNKMDFLLLADEVYLVTTPEPTSIMDTYGLVRILAQEKENPRVKLIINMAGEPSDAQHVMSTMQLITRQFFNLKFEYAGCVGYDPNMTRAVRQQKPITLLYPSSKASRDIERIAMKLADYEVHFLTERGLKAWYQRLVSFFR